MSRPEILLLALTGVFAVIFGPHLLPAVVSFLKRPQAIACVGCGIQIHPSYGTRCSACVTRENELAEAWAKVQRDERARQRSLDAERREAERIASRAPVRTIGTVAVDPFGQVTFEGWQFGSTPDMAPGEVIPIQGRISPTALICGWRQSELHALAHGEHCTCLSRMGAWVR